MEYVVIDTRTDVILVVGTARCCADFLGIQIKTFYAYRTACERRRRGFHTSIRNKRLDIYRLEEYQTDYIPKVGDIVTGISNKEEISIVPFGMAVGRVEELYEDRKRCSVKVLQLRKGSGLATQRLYVFNWSALEPVKEKIGGKL